MRQYFTGLSMLVSTPLISFLSFAAAKAPNRPHSLKPHLFDHHEVLAKHWMRRLMM
ncbi:hypothetical protein BLA6860_04506 [Burkholderia lata]|uniref:hypothetical protein n=1 Tax=Burkholderia lata (strain ATCC 17760 / DSM 23089 / LMG 22485 / NCIMB 9086 / R18194 / 383) TaxID=482957 RepID=UPI001452E2AF|nr:hypothetical protein [Burkholderia lata]VWB94533.1 hypothetical protein BLA6860_04506 [Burkholderia lata]